MRVLFVLKDSFYLRNFESFLRALDARGHEVHVAFDREPSVAYRVGLVEELGADLAGFTTGPAPRREEGPWRRALDELRRTLDYLAYLEPRYDAAPSLRARAAEGAPRLARRWAAHPAGRPPALRRAAARVLGLAEAGVPPSPALTAHVRGTAPDVVVVSPLVRFGSEQADLLVAGRAAGVATCFAAYSWDNLTTKGRVRGDPDLVTTWNAVQAGEAVELHGVPRDRVMVVGASAYDHWFGWRPATTRDEFCSTTGLDPDRPILLYVGSALLTGKEERFVGEWLGRLRASGHEALQGVGVLVRPHPQRPPAAGTLEELGADPNAAVWPPPGASALGVAARQALFDSIYHSSAVVGLNTSAFIDAAIVGRPSFAVLEPRFGDSQDGTLHFRHLVQAGGGLLSVAGSFDEHGDQLADRLADPEAPVSSERFLSAFVRPAGLDRAATDMLVEAVEAQARAGPRPSEQGRLERAAARPLALAAREAVHLRDAFTAADGPRRVRRARRRVRKGARRAARRLRGYAGAALR